MIQFIVGMALIGLAYRTGIGAPAQNRVAIFHGPVGTVVSLIVMLIGMTLVISGLGWTSHLLEPLSQSAVVD